MSIFKQDVGTVKAIYVGNRKVSDAYVGDTHIYSSNVLSTLKGLYLRFSPTNELGTTVSITKKGFTEDNSMFLPKLIYAVVDLTTINNTQQTASITWSSYVFLTSIAIPYGHVMYMKNTIPTLNIDLNNYVQFKIKGLCDVTGSITSMINGNGACNYATFINLFRDCEDMTKCPKLVVSKATTDCFANIFRGCKNLYDFLIDFPGKSPLLATRGHSWYYDTKALLDPPKLYKTLNGYIIDKPMPKIVTSSANIAWVDPRFVYSLVYLTNIFLQCTYATNEGKKPKDIELSIKCNFIYLDRNYEYCPPGGEYLEKCRYTFSIKLRSISQLSGNVYQYNDGVVDSTKWFRILLLSEVTPGSYEYENNNYDLANLAIDSLDDIYNSKTFFALTGIVYMQDILGNAILTLTYNDCRKIRKEYLLCFDHIPWGERVEKWALSYNYSPYTLDLLVNIGMLYNLPVVRNKEYFKRGISYGGHISGENYYLYIYRYEKRGHELELASSVLYDIISSIVRNTHRTYYIGDDMIYDKILSELLFFDNTNEIVVDGYVILRHDYTFVHPLTGQTYEGGTYHLSVWYIYPIDNYNCCVNLKINEYYLNKNTILYDNSIRTIQLFLDDIVSELRYDLLNNYIHDERDYIYEHYIHNVFGRYNEKLYLFHFIKTKPLMYNLEIFPLLYLQAIVDDPTNYKLVELIHPLPTELN